VSDDECIHLNDPALCTICNGKDAAGRRRPPAAPKPAAKRPTATAAKATKAPSTRRVTRTVATQSVDTAESVEQYRTGYSADRQDTFDAYVEVFFTTDARQFPGGWMQFTRCANADPERKETAPGLVIRAEAFMRAAGYAADDTGRPHKSRRWTKDSNSV
jgi:hypothetical protein